GHKLSLSDLLSYTIRVDRLLLSEIGRHILRKCFSQYAVFTVLPKKATRFLPLVVDIVFVNVPKDTGAMLPDKMYDGKLFYTSQRIEAGEYHHVSIRTEGRHINLTFCHPLIHFPVK